MPELTLLATSSCKQSSGNRSVEPVIVESLPELGRMPKDQLRLRKEYVYGGRPRSVA